MLDIQLTGIRGIMEKSRELEKTPFARKMMGDIAFYIMERIKSRTIKGDDVKGNSFNPYSPGYKKWRMKKGYRPFPVDLTLSGHMMSAMTETHNSQQAKIFFMDTDDKTGTSAPDKAFWNNEDREFFGMSEDDIKGIMAIVEDYYEELTGRRTLR